MLVVRMILAFLLWSLSLSAEWIERKVSVTWRSTFEATACAFVLVSSFLIRGITPNIGKPIVPSISKALLTRSSRKATPKISPTPRAMPPKKPAAKFKTTLGEEGWSARGGKASSTIRALGFLRFTWAFSVVMRWLSAWKKLCWTSKSRRSELNSILVLPNSMSSFSFSASLRLATSKLLLDSEYPA